MVSKTTASGAVQLRWQCFKSRRSDSCFCEVECKSASRIRDALACKTLFWNFTLAVNLLHALRYITTALFLCLFQLNLQLPRSLMWIPPLLNPRIVYFLCGFKKYAPYNWSWILIDSTAVWLHQGRLKNFRNSRGPIRHSNGYALRLHSPGRSE